MLFPAQTESEVKVVKNRRKDSKFEIVDVRFLKKIQFTKLPKFSKWGANQLSQSDA